MMKIKMAELVERTGVPKSTILYYIKEGLLPQPERLKQNVCLYDLEYVDRIKFIKYLQNNYGKSIAELKAVACSHGYDFSHGCDILIEFLERLSGAPADSEKMTLRQLCEKTGVEPSFVNELVSKSIIIPLVEGEFDEKDAEMVMLFRDLLGIGWDVEFFEKYAELSRKLAHFSTKKIREMKKRLADEGSMKNEAHHLMFELPLNIQPYIINRLSMLEYRRMSMEDESKKSDN